ncbi:WXG100 family type VII secretion target [Arthrobacter rhizosphaerae]|uniref:WXG100 family type VII secretion target n=1 Tax=Arthrobacter rhizosphaerae TaxID=2855490 RepID=UPI001FF10C69|nr:WXG100 family type VII secretion target [Arthrobacter rhizosphaerae]
MAIWGADVESLRQLGGKLLDGSQEIAQTKSRLTGQVNTVDWKGPDAEAFIRDWNGEHTTALNRVIQALEEAGQKAKNNATAQESTSQSH